ncbi:MAG: hypothetical protein GY761_05720 [Hyphomicrobiales bacterium]|nr:hypothetical protein [Hyphomicrobiales bacterium]
MRTFPKSVFVTSAFAAVTMIAITFDVSDSQASNRKSSDKAYPTNPAIDMIVTGSNKSSVKVDNPSVGKNGCGLCYHRDIINKRDDNNSQKPAQAHPGNQGISDSVF